MIPLMMGGTCSLRQDTSVLSAAAANDMTLIFSGCSENNRDGMILCRSSSGAGQTTEITIHMPKLNCDREVCAQLDIVRKDGTIHPLGAIPKGDTALVFKLSQVTGSTGPVTPGMGGPYRVLSEAFYEHEGEEWRVLGVGIIYLLVLKPGYVPLGCGSPDMAWRLKLRKKCEAQYSTKMRTALCGEGCHAR